MRVKELIHLLKTMDGESSIYLKGPFLHINSITNIVSGNSNKGENWTIIHYDDDYALNLQKQATESIDGLEELSAQDRNKKKNIIARIENLEMRMREMYAMQSDYRNWIMNQELKNKDHLFFNLNSEKMPVAGVPVIVLNDLKDQG
jgi:hypothetical protein